MRTYLARHAWGNTGLADLLAALEEASGRDLQAWSAAWLRTTGPSTLRVVDGALTATGDRPHRVGVGVYDGSPLRLRERVLLDVDGAPVPVGVDLDADLVLPNDGDLTFAKVRLDPRSLATVRARLHEVPDPLARALVWGALWDTARDGELPAEDLVAAVLGSVDGEDDPDLVTTLLGQARTAAHQLTADGAPLLARLHAHHVAAQHAPGSALQRVVFRAAVDTATGPVAPPPGVAVDEELRWHLLQREAALGLVGADALQAAHDAAPTATSANALAHALASRPDPAAKEAAWAELLGDGPLSNSRARALASGFWQHGQDDLLAPWVARYADEVPGLWERRSPQLAGSVTRLLFPATLVRQEVLDATGGLVADDRPAGLRRLVLEARDDLARALRARGAADRAQGGRG